MSADKSFLLKVLLGALVLAAFPSFSWAAALSKTDVSGFCCVNNVLGKTTEKQCEKYRGKFYLEKENVRARKECHPRSAAISVESVMAGFCCIDGRISELPYDECSRRKGHIYKSVADAQKRCKAVPSARSSVKQPPRQTTNRIIPPDLLISRFSASSKRINSGDRVRLTVQIKNAGKRSLQNVTVKFYNSDSKRVLGKKSVTIAAQASAQATITVALVGKGRIRISAVVDPDRKIKESNEKNNERKTVIAFTESRLDRKTKRPELLPDLIPVALKLNKKNITVGESLTIQATIKNSGTKSLGQSIHVKFLINDTVIAIKKIRVPVNSTRSVTTAYTVKRAGQHSFSCVIDPDNRIVERNERNNKRYLKIAVAPRAVSHQVPGQIILLVDSNSEGRSLLQQLITRYTLKIVKQRTLESLQRLMVVCATEEDVQQLNQKLRQEDGLYDSQPNRIFSTLSAPDPLRAMQSIDTLVDLDAIHQQASGKNVRVAIIDTGVDIEHRDLQKSIKAHENFIEDSAYQGEIHGTAVAGIIAAARNDFGIIGIAPDAELLVYRACRQRTQSQPEGECYTSSIAAAIDAAIVAQAKIANLSIGSERSDALISSLITEGSRRGMRFVAPVGNNSQTDRVQFPASHPLVIAVAGFDEMDKPVPNKSLTQRADALAPSEHIFSSIPDNRHNFVNGTSFSAATITGLMALSLEKPDSSMGRKLPSSSKAALWQTQFSAYIDL